MIYLLIFLCFLLSVLIAWVIIPHIFLISLRKHLFDVPDERKIHKRAIPRLGGVSFFPTILFSFCFVLTIRLLVGCELESVYTQKLLPEFLLLGCGMTLLYLTGIKDDLVGVRYSQKFAIQLFCACLFPLSGLWVNDFYGLFGLHSLPFWLGMPFTVLIVVFTTNAINLIDGIDGLASGLSGIALTILGVLFMEQELWTHSMFSFSAVGVLIPFFFYNVFSNGDRSRKIFMGDTGSLSLGYVLSFLAIKYSYYESSVMPDVPNAFLVAFSTLILPVFDVMRVMLIRLRKKKPLFEPDRNHIHHKFLDMGYSARQTMVFLLILSLAFSLGNIWLIGFVNNTLLLMGNIVVWVGLNLWWDKRKRGKQMKRKLKELENGRS
ncbi:putative undecaprenyl-phosphate N-acetylglucosaminyl 1-phosphate transferase [termite gut metagenome]|uniref:Putative undecaprenyl-phosphate N-acetylglucosaminyl 1-phosphate transferase n=1 Tax=termite gut metagenome TaxID=433724 RepID=A0A5J4T262_9ZZZZ